MAKHLMAQACETDDPEVFLANVMKDGTLDVRERKDAAKALLQYRVRSAKAKGKKQSKADDAKEVAVSGRFAPGVIPFAQRAG